MEAAISSSFDHFDSDSSLENPLTFRLKNKKMTSLWIFYTEVSVMILILKLVRKAESTAAHRAVYLVGSSGAESPLLACFLKLFINTCMSNLAWD